MIKVMKQILILIFVFFFSFSYSQTKNVDYLTYIPIRTYHFDRSPYLPYYNTEGGTYGIVLIRRDNHKKMFTDIDLGALQNSYNKLSIIGQYGIGIKTKIVNPSVHVGFISGYKEMFEPHDIISSEITEIPMMNGTVKYITVNNTKTVYPDNDDIYKYLPNFMKQNGIIPAVNLSLAFTTGTRFSPQINISPAFVNVGLTIRLTK